MTQKAVFAGLVVDEENRPVAVVYVGDEPMYVVDDMGFRRHIPSESVDRQVFDFLREQMKGHEDAIGEQTAKMLGQDDLFSRAMIMNQLKQMDKQFDTLLETGIPEDARAYMGMMGFRVVINVHGEVVDVQQPSAPADGGEE